MYADTTGGHETPGLTKGGLILNSDAEECPGCGRALSAHGFTFDGPGGRATLSPCGLDVSGVPVRKLVDAIRSDDLQEDTDGEQQVTQVTETGVEK